MIAPDKIRKADFLSAFLFLAISVSLVWGSLLMPLSGTYGGRPIYWYTSPGFVPLLLGLALMVLSLLLLGNAFKQKGQHKVFTFLRDLLIESLRRQYLKKILILWLLVASYIVCLTLHPFASINFIQDWDLGESFPFLILFEEPENFNFVMATFIYLDVFILFFAPFFVRKSFWIGLLIVSAFSIFFSIGLLILFSVFLSTTLP